jgi:hypothetical protein
LSNSQEFPTADIFFGFTMTGEQKWFNALLILVRPAWPTCNIEVLDPGLFTLHPLRLIARKLAMLILTQQNVIMDTSLGSDNSGKKIKFSPQF